jgi:branched-chain amino acid transport system substrate-binding protein
VLGAALATSIVPARAADQPPYEINVVLSLTGSAAFLGKEEQQALAAVEKVVNSGGGIRGRQLRFVYQDDSSSPQVAVQLTNAVIAKHVPVFIGSSLVAQCLAMSALVKENGPVQYCLSPGIHPEHGSYTYSTSVSTRDQATAFVRYFRSKGWNKVALLTSTDATGQDAERNFVEALHAQSGEQIVAQEHFAPTDVSVTAQLARIKGANPQVLVAWTTGTPFGTVLHGISDTGFDLPIVGGNGNIIYAEMHQFRQFLPKTLMFAGVQAFRDPKQVTGPLRAAIEEYNKALAPTKPDLGQSLAYDPGMIVVNVLRRLGTNATPKQVRDAILNLRGYVGINGVYNFSTGDNRGLGVGNVVLVRYDAGRDLFVPISKPGGARI